MYDGVIMTDLQVVDQIREFTPTGGSHDPFFKQLINSVTDFVTGVRSEVLIRIRGGIQRTEPRESDKLGILSVSAR